MTKMILIEEAVVKQALEALELVYATCDWHTDDGNEAMQKASAAITSLRTAIEQMEKQEPAPVQGGYKLVPVELTLAMKQAWVRSLTPSDAWSAMLAAAPAAQRQLTDVKSWVGLTDEDVTWLCNTAKSHEQTWGMVVRTTEAKLKAKNSP